MAAVNPRGEFHRSSNTVQTTQEEFYALQAGVQGKKFSEGQMSGLYRFVEHFNSGTMANVIGTELGNLSPHCGSNNVTEVANDIQRIGQAQLTISDKGLGAIIVTLCASRVSLEEYSDEQKGEILALAYFLSSRTFQSDEVKGAVEALKTAITENDTANIQKQIGIIQARFTEGYVGWAASRTPGVSWLFGY